MTLIIAGFNLEKPAFPLNNNIGGMKSEGLFVATDSLISAKLHSNKVKAVLSNFNKVYRLTYRTFRPHFVGSYFNGNFYPYRHGDFFVAFAGGTTIAQHVINKINNHVSNLQISYASPSEPKSYDEDEGEFYYEIGKYFLCMPCEHNPMFNKQSTTNWAEMFKTDKLTEIITADLLIDVIKHSIEHAFHSTKKYISSELDANTLSANFIVGIYCRVTEKHKLYEFTMNKHLDIEGKYDFYIHKKEIAENAVAVIGLKQYHSGANDLINTLISKSTPPAYPYFAYLNTCIDQSVKKGNSTIDRPSFLYIFKEGELSLVNRTD